VVRKSVPSVVARVAFRRPSTTVSSAVADRGSRSLGE
jgi:hypothetical protein